MQTQWEHIFFLPSSEQKPGCKGCLQHLPAFCCPAAAPGAQTDRASPAQGGKTQVGQIKSSRSKIKFYF